MQKIDLNCDMGESFGAWKMGRDAELMDYVSSVNIACGFHAGDPTVIRQTIETAVRKGVSVGAHPSFPDLQGFGRREMRLTPEEIYDIVLYQVAAVKGICESLGIKLHHVKPHGALYNQAARDPAIARAIGKAVKSIDDRLILYGLSGSHSITESEKIGLYTASEVFADRTYTAEGLLTPRSEPNALIEDGEQAIRQVLQIVKEQTVTATGGETVPLKADTVCIHGDGANALEFARIVRESLLRHGIEVSAIWHIF